MRDENVKPVFRVHLIYFADGMTRPLSHRMMTGAESSAKAVEIIVNFVRTAYVSGFKVVSWSCENLTAAGPKLLGGALADEVEAQREREASAKTTP